MIGFELNQLLTPEVLFPSDFRKQPFFEVPLCQYIIRQNKRSSKNLHYPNIQKTIYLIPIMKKLKKEFIGKAEVKGFHFHQMIANENGFLYEVSQPHTSQKHYEVFKHKITKSHPKANSDELVVAYPKSNAFGLWAWSYLDYQAASEKFLAITDASTYKIIGNQKTTALWMSCTMNS